MNTDDPVRATFDVHRATVLMREFLEVSESFERSLGGELGVNATDLEAMEHLISAGPLSPGELSRRLGISTASTTTAIDRLVGLGHARREPNPQDRRGILVVPSPASARRAMQRLLPMITDVDAVLDRYSPQEQHVITDYLDRVVAIYRSHAEVGPEYANDDPDVEPDRSSP